MFYDDRITNKLASDQHYDLLLNYYGEAKAIRMISESALLRCWSTTTIPKTSHCADGRRGNGCAALA